MKNTFIFAFIIGVSFSSWASYKAYFPKNITIESDSVSHAQVISPTAEISLDSNGYVMLINSNGTIIELDKKGTYSIDSLPVEISDSDVSVSKNYVKELMNFLELTPLTVEYNRIGSVSFKPTIYNSPILAFFPEQLTWYKNIPFNLYFKANKNDDYKFNITNLFNEHLHQFDINESKVSFKSDSLFNYLSNLKEMDNKLVYNINYATQSNYILNEIQLKTDSTLSKSYSEITQTNYSPFVQQLLKMTFFEQNKMDTYHLSSLVEAYFYVRRHPKLEENLTLMSSQYAKHYKIIYKMITESR